MDNVSTVVEGKAPATKKTAKPKAYRVKVTTSVLRVRKAPSTDAEIVGRITYNGVFTVVEEAKGKGADRWGKLENGEGWIALDYTTKI